MSGTLYSIDATTFGVWKGTTYETPRGMERNRTCARDWLRCRRAGRTHPRDGYMGALLRLNF